ncbi:MAG: bifunctional demethylmenaquinone methyltransferase/2-methoxy-6-polyprenyl-1,4-benzoquinol methylase UbiE [Tepidisphaera sp.]|nr:bifunctional demethylmenaquinone methyltransferase/2-methoxy-6-polyprenyl-1,4-benzoquinol methylase UbiE [Tepidisphaera sp.]
MSEQAPANSDSAPAAWSDAELSNPHAREDKPARVRRMFDAIAGSYDLNNRVHSLWQDQRWRRFAVRAAAVKPGDIVVDVACGTGDLTQAFARTGAAHVIGIDFTHNMLKVAMEKRRGEARAGKMSYFEGDAMNLPLADGCADVVSIAFGIRNVADPKKALGEFARVLRPGGRLVILEFDQPRFPLMRWFNNLYCRRIMPVTATAISADKTGAYKYLPASVGTFMSREEMVAAIAAAGFTGAKATGLSLGICACYRALRSN